MICSNLKNVAIIALVATGNCYAGTIAASPIVNPDTTTVPEPTTIVLFAISTLFLLRRRKPKVSDK
ncbi:MAG: PEP-CTERM sorting domain-containing protein [Phycisphaerae bacterium]|nr:PEP-CTERM sorting domain-containing protein [Phycisphaerae bacterium]